VSLEDKMNNLLSRLGVPLKAVWLPSRDAKEHARIVPEERLIMIYDEGEDEAWASLLHEIMEWRLRPVHKVYRDTINKLITLLEEIAYSRKEEALSHILDDFMAWKSLEEKTQGSTGKST